jgi:hypothetical protein
VSTFRRHMEVVLDDESFKVVTMAKDHLRAEEAIGRDKLPVDSAALHLQLRVAFYSFGRCFPDHALARNWSGFCEAFDDINDLDEEDQGSLMDPTQVGDWES